MANIYQDSVKTAQTTSVTNESRPFEGFTELFGKASKVVSGVAEQKKKEYVKEQTFAEKLYASDLSSKMSQIANTPELSANPQALNKQLDKLASTYAGQIQDEKTKLAVMTDFEMKRAPIITRATNAFYKQQEENNKAVTYNNIQSNMENVGIALSNIFGKDGTEADLGYVRYGYDLVKQQINARKPDGSFMFSNAERRAMQDDYNKRVLKEFEIQYENMPDDQKELIKNSLKGNSLFYVKNEKGENVIAQMGDVIQPAMLADMKKYIINEREKAYAFAKKEDEARRKRTYDNFLSNPTQQGYEELMKDEKLTKEQKRKISEAHKIAPDYSAESEDISKTYILDKLNEMAKEEKYTPQEQFELGLDTIISIRSQKKLSPNDMQKYCDEVVDILNDSDLRAVRAGISKQSKDFLNQMREYFALDANFFWQEKTEEEKKTARTVLNKLMQNTNDAISELFNRTDLSVDEKKRKARDIYKVAQKQIVWYKFPEIDGMNVGDTVTIDGITYEIADFMNGDFAVKMVK